MTTSRAPVRVLHVIHDLRPGGAEHVLVDMAAAAPSVGIDMSVVSLRPVESFDVARRLTRAGVRVESLGLAGWWDPRGERRLGRLIDENETDIVHSHLKHADVVAGKVASARSIPHISTLHLVEDEVGWIAARKREVAIRSRMKTAVVTVAVSEAVRRWYLGVSEADSLSVITLHNGVPDPGRLDPAEVAAMRLALDAEDDSVLLVMLAVMRPGKGHDTLIDALPLINDDRVVVAFAGDGGYRARLEERARHDERIRFLGWRDDIDRLLAAADIVVHPSLADALPTALVHALAAGKPIIASGVGGIPEIVPSDGGILVPPGDPAALADAIDELAADADARMWMGKQARERYDSEFRVDHWVRRLRMLYDQVREARS